MVAGGFRGSRKDGEWKGVVAAVAVGLFRSLAGVDPPLRLGHGSWCVGVLKAGAWRLCELGIRLLRARFRACASPGP